MTVATCTEAMPAEVELTEGERRMLDLFLALGSLQDAARAFKALPKEQLPKRRFARQGWREIQRDCVALARLAERHLALFWGDSSIPVINEYERLRGE